MSEDLKKIMALLSDPVKSSKNPKNIESKKKLGKFFERKS